MLSDPESRKKYDREGKSGIEGHVKMDPSTFFSLLFGSERFEPWMGELPLGGARHDQKELGRGFLIDDM